MIFLLRFSLESNFIIQFSLIGFMEEEKRYTDKEQNAGYHTFFRQPEGRLKEKLFF
jgi:hypothetical protein